MKVLFLSPNYPLEMQDFTRGLAEVGADVVGIGDTPRDGLSPKVKSHLAGYLQVPLQNPEAVLTAVRATGVRFDRVECLWEPFVELAAWLRERLGVPGMTLDTARAFRDKELMKQRVEAAGLRVPHHTRANTREEVWAAAERFGFPLILKPIAGAGSADTFRVDDAKELEVALARTAHVPEVSVEEFVDGEEFTFDTVCIDGKPAYANIAQYHPRPLQARSNEWISPIVVTIRDMWAPAYKPGIELGLGVLRALNMGTGFTHMEWYKKANGEVVFGEIGARSAGGHLVDQMNWTGDIDLYREWARAVCWKSFEGDTRRKNNVAIIFKRARGQGRIQRIEGLERYLAKYGAHVVAEQLLRPGAQRRDWLQTLVSDGFVCVRHPDLSATLQMAQAAATDVTMYAE
ncbi:MAG: ATP-grasp domain-containing protein [Pseudomonadota bacterium]|nr:ATP-grasp domain-containing protein [Pseudomonadota bacterium]